MPLTEKRKRELAFRRRQVVAVEGLFVRDDVGKPRLLMPRDRRALRTTLGAVVECEMVFKHVRRHARITRSYEVDFLCDSIRAAVDAFDDIKAMGRIVKGASVSHPLPRANSLKGLLQQHGLLYARLTAEPSNLPERLSNLIKMTQIELIFWGHMW